MDKSVKKKRMIIALCTVFALALVAAAVLLVGQALESAELGKEDEETTLRPLLAIPNWDYNVYEDEQWLGKNHYITYSEGGVSVMITDEIYDGYGICVEFMALYFEALKMGNAEALCGFYADEYFNDNYRWDEITMQAVYDVKLEYVSAKSDIDKTTYVYKVSYKIMKNDGTFRNDVKSDAERPEYYTIVDDGSKLKITAVSYNYAQ